MKLLLQRVRKLFNSLLLKETNSSQTTVCGSIEIKLQEKKNGFDAVFFSVIYQSQTFYVKAASLIVVLQKQATFFKKNRYKKCFNVKVKQGFFQSRVND